MSTQTLIRKPSVQSLYVEMGINGTKLSSGTAFVVDTAKGPHLITNRHNVTGRDQNKGQPLSPTAGLPNQIIIWHNAASGLGAWQSSIELLLKPDGNQRRLTLDNVSGIAGMSVQHLSEIESSKRDPRLSSIERIADAMELAVMPLPEHMAPDIRRYIASQGRVFTATKPTKETSHDDPA